MGVVHQSDDLLDYFRRELTYLRAQGRDFAERHPRVAKRLALGEAESADPHTERLIEAFAFLAARIHRDIDSEFPQLATVLLENVCPSLAYAVPSMTIVQMTLDASQGKVTSGLAVQRGAQLQAMGHDGRPCHFQVAWDTTLWPLSVSRVTVEEGRSVTIRLQTDAGVDLQELELDSLRLHLCGELLTCMPVHELLITALSQVDLLTSDGQTKRLGPEALLECGFGPDEDVLPRPAHAHPAYSLMHEYFCFPRKFQFFEIKGLRGSLGSGSYFEIRLVFDRAARVLSSLKAANFKLGCVPVVNLFAMTSEPVKMDRRQHEYLLVADRQRESSTEIHSVLSVTASDLMSARAESIPPLFGVGQQSVEDPAGSCWYARRERSLRADLTGTDTYIGIAERTPTDQISTDRVVYAHVLCTNRRVAEQVPAGAKLLGAGLSRSMNIRALYAPSAQREPPLSSRALWALMAILQLNHRSLLDEAQGVVALKDLMMLFAGEGAAEQAQIRALTALRAQPGVARMGHASWRGFCRGTDVELVFDVDAFAGGSPLLLSAVLARFLALYTTANTFVRLSVTRGQEVWKQWPAMAGGQVIV